jgi:hypothetical protein
MSQGQGGGRPHKFKSADEIRIPSQKYFDDCKENKDGITVSGLAVALGTFRDVLMDYESGVYDDECQEDSEKFSNAIKWAKSVCEAYAAKAVFTNPAGGIFHVVNITRNSKNPLKDIRNQEVTGNNGGPVEYKGLNDADIESRIATILGKAGTIVPVGREGEASAAT